MKYGIIVSPKREYNNIGDEIMLLSLKYIYERMGISYADVIKINFRELVSYEGEDVVLPVAFPLFGYNELNKLTCWSPKIKPVFLGVALCNTNLDDEDIEYFKKYEPIGCRDDFTCQGLRKLGIRTYLNGCMSLTLPSDNKITNRRDKVYCVDVYDDLIRHIPESIVDRCEWRSSLTEDYVDIDYVEKVFREYREHAQLIITSRLHCALPCMAYGIPVVFVHDIFDQRFTWLEGLITIYTPDMYDEINWEPEPVQIEQLRDAMTKNAIARIKKNTVDQILIDSVERFYLGRNKREFRVNFTDAAVRYAQQYWNTMDRYEYAVWGCAPASNAVIDYFDEHYPNAKLVAVIDTYKDMIFHGMRTIRIQELNNIMNVVVVVVDAATKQASEYFNKIGKSKDTYICETASKFILK
jgi:hypothetical protein